MEDLWLKNAQHAEVLPYFHYCKQSDYFVNVEFICKKNVRTFGHMLLVSSFSLHMKRLLKPHQNEPKCVIMLPDFDAAVVEKFLAFMYIGTVNLSDSVERTQFLNLADVLKVELPVAEWSPNGMVLISKSLQDEADLMEAEESLEGEEEQNPRKRKLDESPEGLVLSNVYSTSWEDDQGTVAPKSSKGNSKGKTVKRLHNYPPCIYCQKTFPICSDLLDHISKTHFKEHFNKMAEFTKMTCKLCNKDFQNSYRYTLHVGSVHKAVLLLMEDTGMKDQADEIRAKIPNNVTSKIVETWKDLGTENVIDEIEAEFPFPKAVTTIIENDPDDIETTDTPDQAPTPVGRKVIVPPCKLCNKNYPTLSGLIVHIAKTHFKERLVKISKDTDAWCKICSKQFSESFVEHVGGAHKAVLLLLEDHGMGDFAAEVRALVLAQPVKTPLVQNWEELGTEPTLLNDDMSFGTPPQCSTMISSPDPTVTPVPFTINVKREALSSTETRGSMLSTPQPKNSLKPKPKSKKGAVSSRSPSLQKSDQTKAISCVYCSVKKQTFTGILLHLSAKHFNGIYMDLKTKHHGECPFCTNPIKKGIPFEYARHVGVIHKHTIKLLKDAGEHDYVNTLESRKGRGGKTDQKNPLRDSGVKMEPEDPLEIGQETIQIQLENDLCPFCTFCGKAGQRRAHIAVEHFKDDYMRMYTVNDSKCPDCNKVCRDWMEYATHVGGTHKHVDVLLGDDNPVAPLTKSPKGRNPPPCFKCGVKFPVLNKLLFHLSNHFSSKFRTKYDSSKGTCYLCTHEEKHFSDYGRYKKHLACVHRMALQFAPKSFQNAVEEVGAGHTSGKPKKSFKKSIAKTIKKKIIKKNTKKSTQKTRKVSKKTAINDSSPNYPCPKCGVVLKRPRDRRSHIAKTHFESHYIEMFDVSEGKCYSCDKALPTWSAYAVHLAVAHKHVDSLMEDNSEQEIMNPEEPLNGSLPPCYDCGKQYSVVSRLLKHMVCHFDEKFKALYKLHHGKCHLGCKTRSFHRYFNYRVHIGGIHRSVLDYVPQNYRERIEAFKNDA